MLMGRVVGEVWATRKEPRMDGLRLVIVKQVDLVGAVGETYVIAVDAVGAGLGARVLVCQGSSARQTESTNGKPVDAVVMAIVDDWHVEDRDWVAFDARTSFVNEATKS